MSSAISRARWLADKTIAISVSEPDDLASLGLSRDHLNDAFAELARQLLSLGAQLVYGGDLRQGGYTEMLFELVARYKSRSARSAEARPAVINALPYPVHATLSRTELIEFESRFAHVGVVMYLRPDGQPLRLEQRLLLPPVENTELMWDSSLSAMRRFVSKNCDARVLLGGRVSGYRGKMPGVIEEALIAVQDQKPIYVIGGFGGICRELSAFASVEVDVDFGERSSRRFTTNNKLTLDEAVRLAKSPHIDEVVLLIVRGLRRLFG